MVYTEKIPDLNEKRTFHSPLTKSGYSIIAIPQAVVKTARYLNGKTILLKEAMAKIEMASRKINGKVRLNHDCITLRAETRYETQFWCVVKFR